MGRETGRAPVGCLVYFFVPFFLFPSDSSNGFGLVRFGGCCVSRCRVSKQDLLLTNRAVQTRKKHTREGVNTHGSHGQHVFIQVAGVCFLPCFVVHVLHVLCVVASMKSR